MSEEERGQATVELAPKTIADNLSQRARQRVQRSRKIIMEMKKAAEQCAGCKSLIGKPASHPCTKDSGWSFRPR